MPSLLLRLPRLLWDHRTKVLAAVVVLLLLYIRKQNAALAARPAVETHVETKIVTRTVQGPTRYVRREIVKPSGERVIERELTRESLERVVDKSVERDRISTPVGALAGRRWLVGVGETLPRGVDPRDRLTLYGGHFWGNLGVIGHANPYARGWEPGLAIAIAF